MKIELLLFLVRYVSCIRAEKEIANFPGRNRLKVTQTMSGIQGNFMRVEVCCGQQFLSEITENRGVSLLTNVNNYYNSILPLCTCDFQSYYIFLKLLGIILRYCVPC